MNKRQYLLADQNITEKDLNDLIDWLKTNPRLTQGSLVKEFERKWSSWLGANHSIFVNSGSSGILLMYYAAMLSGRMKNKKIIIPAVSWASTVTPALQLGFEPVMCEAEEETFGICPRHLESLLKEHEPACVIIVHVLGVPVQIEPLMKLKKRFNFLLLEDACAATGSTYDGRLVGTFGEMSSFSFYYSHHLSTIEGGMVSTNDEELNDILRQIRSYGWSKDIRPEIEEKKSQEYDIDEFNKVFTFFYPGFNVRSTDLNARIGLSQMERIDSILNRRIENHKIYQSRFRSIPGFRFQSNSRAIISSISFGVMAGSVEHRSKIHRVLEEKGIETRPLGGGNMSRQPFWVDRYKPCAFPIADRIHTTGFQLPNHPMLMDEDINRICDTVLACESQV